MTPRQYEELVAEELRKEGWDAELTAYGADYGVDVFASRNGDRIAVQAKMYGTARPVNRAMVMQLHGAAAYFDCKSAMVVTDGRVLPDAAEVAAKLGIVVRHLLPHYEVRPLGRTSDQGTFDAVWREHVMPLAGTTLTRANGLRNEILDVDWGGVVRRTSNGRRQRIGIEIFESVINRLLAGEIVTRDSINDDYPGRASSGIVLILSAVPLFETMQGPLALRLRRAGEMTR